METSFVLGRLYTALLQNQLFRYMIVGGIALVADTGILYILTQFFQIYYLISASLGFISGLVLNYLLSIVWVFNHRKVKKMYVEFAIFAAIGLIGLFWNELIMYLLVGKFGLYFLYAKVMTAAFVFFWNFLARKVILFRETRKEEVN